MCSLCILADLRRVHDAWRTSASARQLQPLLWQLQLCPSTAMRKDGPQMITAKASTCTCTCVRSFGFRLPTLAGVARGDHALPQGTIIIRTSYAHRALAGTCQSLAHQTTTAFLVFRLLGSTQCGATESQHHRTIHRKS
eukprot:scaffold27137_cov121-Isochrysis_galbana.AAC.1